jgi:hypothetical protein
LYIIVIGIAFRRCTSVANHELLALQQLQQLIPFGESLRGSQLFKKVVDGLESSAILWRAAQRNLGPAEWCI